LVVLGVHTAGGPQGASARRRAAARDHFAGKVVAIAARRALPLSVRRQVAGRLRSDAAIVRTSRATYLLGGTRRGEDGTPIPIASVLRTSGHGAAVRVAKLPVAVRGAAGAAVGDKIFALGGELRRGRPSALIQEYDVATERSVIAARLPDGVTNSAALTLDGFVYLLGGMVHGSAIPEIVRFDPLRETVVVAGRLPVPATGGIPAASRRRRGYLVHADVSGYGPLTFEITVGKHGH
jgi:hypothetical protein